MSSPKVATMRVIPVAGQDSMLLNLSGAHAPYFTRNLLVLTDSDGKTGVGEVPGGEKIRSVLEQAAPLVIGRPIGACCSRYKRHLRSWIKRAEACRPSISAPLCTR